jgi:SAM-dependent methyltransferase
MVCSAMRQAIDSGRPLTDLTRIDRMRVETARSFGFEWSRFPEMRAEWESNFWDYMSPHTPESFRGKRVLDAGCGGGRHAYYAAKNGAEVWAVDIGSAVEVAKANNQNLDNVRVAQADIHHLPFEPESFDLVYSIGVLHHLSDPESAFRNLLRYVKPGGWIHIYLYWRPENQPVKRALLSLVRAARRITTRIPHRLLYGLSYPVAAVAFAGFVLPYQLLLAAGLNGIAERMPMKQYAKYPFRVCVNDQFDRLSAPIEFRYARDEVEGWMWRAGLEEIIIRPNYGWCATGRKPAGS